MPLECGDEIWRQKTGIMQMQYGEEIMNKNFYKTREKNRYRLV